MDVPFPAAEADLPTVRWTPTIATVRVVAMAAIALLAVGACAKEVDGPNPLAAPTTTQPERSTPDPGASTSSALDALEVAYAETFEGPRRDLAGLIVSPAALGDDMQLALLRVDDPNGTGRIDERWYPPQVRRQDCAINVDTPPMPMAAAAFVPGDPDEQLDDDTLAGQQAVLGAPISVSIEVKIFDDSSQRDGLADAMVEFYESMGDLDCEMAGPQGGELSDLALGEIEELPLHDTGFPGFAFVTEGLLAHSLVSQYSVGDRVLLTVTVAGSNPASEAGDRREPDPSLARQAIDAEIARLDAEGLT